MKGKKVLGVCLVLVTVALGIGLAPRPAYADHDVAVQVNFFGYPDYLKTTVEEVHLDGWKFGQGYVETKSQCARFHSAGQKVVQQGTKVVGLNAEGVGWRLALGHIQIENGGFPFGCFSTKSRSISAIRIPNARDLAIVEFEEVALSDEYRFGCERGPNAICGLFFSPNNLWQHLDRKINPWFIDIQDKNFF